MITDATECSHVRLSNAELSALADRCVRLHGDSELKLYLLHGCQDVLLPDRRRDKLPYSMLKAMRPYIEHSRKHAVEDESTTRLREVGVLGDPRNGRADFYAAVEPIAPAEVKESMPVVMHARMAPLPAPVVTPRPIQHVPAADVREFTADLIEINRLVLRLKAADPALLSQAGELDAKRIQSLVIQASNGLVFFEEIAAMARRL